MPSPPSEPPRPFESEAFCLGRGDDVELPFEKVGLAAPNEETRLEWLEMSLLFEGIYRHYGVDFRAYSPTILLRRLRRLMENEGVATISALQDRVFRDPQCLGKLVDELTINATSMFRDPSFFLAFREQVVPVLRTYPFLRVWHAGCATGEEVYSLAILLTEEGLYDRTRLYATDVNESVLRRAREGIYPLTKMREYTVNYQQAGGRRAFSDYYTARYDAALFDPQLGRHVVFARHNLVSDGGFSEFHVIFCRNVLIYFGRPLKERVVGLFSDSLARGGLLALGRRESLRFTSYEGRFEPFVASERVYRKVSL
jgi:chemotaxis protein methyltransferase CheR